MQVSVYERTKQSRYQNRRTGENRTQKRPAHRQADRGRGRADFDQKSPSSPRHQGDAGGRAGRPRTGCAGRAGSAMKKPQPFGWGF